MNIMELLTSLTGFCCFYNTENLPLAGTDSDLSAVLGYTPEEFENKFDRVICDVPCSGLGVLRRKPDIKWTKSEGSGVRPAIWVEYK